MSVTVRPERLPAATPRSREGSRSRDRPVRRRLLGKPKGLWPYLTQTLRLGALDGPPGAGTQSVNTTFQIIRRRSWRRICPAPGLAAGPCRSPTGCRLPVPQAGVEPGMRRFRQQRARWVAGLNDEPPPCTPMLLNRDDIGEIVDRRARVVLARHHRVEHKPLLVPFVQTCPTLPHRFHDGSGKPSIPRSRVSR